MKNIGSAIKKELEELEELEELKELNPAVKFRMYVLNDNPSPIIYGNIPADQLKFPNDCEYDEKTLIAKKHNTQTCRYVSFVYAYDPSMS